MVLWISLPRAPDSFTVRVLKSWTAALGVVLLQRTVRCRLAKIAKRNRTPTSMLGEWKGHLAKIAQDLSSKTIQRWAMYALLVNVCPWHDHDMPWPSTTLGTAPKITSSRWILSEPSTSEPFCEAPQWLQGVRWRITYACLRQFCWAAKMISNVQNVHVPQRAIVLVVTLTRGKTKNNTSTIYSKAAPIRYTTCVLCKKNMREKNIPTHSNSLLHHLRSLAFHQPKSVDTKAYTSEGGGIRRGLQVGPGQWCTWNSMEYRMVWHGGLWTWQFQ